MTRQRKDEEERLGSLAHRVADNVADGLAAVTDGSEQRAEVMHAADKDTAKYAPQENRNPTEHGSLDRTVDRACARDGREVVAHQDRRFGRDVVNAVGHGVCRRRTLRIDTPLLGQPCTISDITDHEQDDSCKNNQYSSHVFSLSY